MTKATNNAFERAVADAVAHQRAGRLRAAAYREALEASPGHPVATHNLGVVAAALGNHFAAVGHFDRAIAVESRYAAATGPRRAASARSRQCGEACVGALGDVYRRGLEEVGALLAGVRARPS